MSATPRTLATTVSSAFVPVYHSLVMDLYCSLVCLDKQKRHMKCLLVVAYFFGFMGRGVIVILNVMYKRSMKSRWDGIEVALLPALHHNVVHDTANKIASSRIPSP